MEETPAGNRFIEEEGYYLLTVQVNCSFSGLGYQVLTFEEQETTPESSLDQNTWIRNGKYMLSFEDDHLIYSDGKQQIVDFLSIIDDSNAGDTYDYSPILNDQPITLRFASCKGKQETLVLEGSLQLPYTIEERMKGIATKTFAYTLTLQLTKNGEVNAKLRFKNTLLNHRIRVKARLNKPIERAFAANLAILKKEIKHWKIGKKNMQKNPSMLNHLKNKWLFMIKRTPSFFIASRAKSMNISTTPYM